MVVFRREGAALRSSGALARVSVLGAVVLAGVLAAGSASLAADKETPVHLYDRIADLVENHKRIKSEAANVEKSRQDLRVAKGDWFPDLDTTASYGYEDQQKGQGTADTTLQPRRLDLTLTQKVWDFGGTNATIRAAELDLQRAEITEVAVRQQVIGEGVRAYMNLLRAQRLLEFARASVDNIKRQTELEDARVERGSGFSTDVLQAKRQLAGASARRVRAEGTLRTAINRFLAVFDELPRNPKAMKRPRVPVDLLPETVDDAVDAAMAENPELLQAALQAQIRRTGVDSARASSFFPELNAIGEMSKQNDVSGTVGHKTESSVRLELTYNLNLGLTAINSLRAAKQDHLATEHLYGDARDRIEERVRSAWDRLETAKLNAEFLNNQANIASEFLELARRERQLGNRSLIDVLTGETELINATSDALSAEVDAAIAVYDLLAAMGRLELQTVPMPDDNRAQADDGASLAALPGPGFEEFEPENASAVAEPMPAPEPAPEPRAETPAPAPAPEPAAETPGAASAPEPASGAARAEAADEVTYLTFEATPSEMLRAEPSFVPEGTAAAAAASDDESLEPGALAVVPVDAAPEIVPEVVPAADDPDADADTDLAALSDEDDEIDDGKTVIESVFGAVFSAVRDLAPALPSGAAAPEAPQAEVPEAPQGEAALPAQAAVISGPSAPAEAPDMAVVPETESAADVMGYAPAFSPDAPQEVLSTAAPKGRGERQ